MHTRAVKSSDISNRNPHDREALIKTLSVVEQLFNFVYITSSNLATFSSETPITGKLFETVSQKTGGRKNPYFAVFVSRLTGTIFNLAVSYLTRLERAVGGLVSESVAFGGYMYGVGRRQGGVSNS